MTWCPARSQACLTTPPHLRRRPCPPPTPRRPPPRSPCTSSWRPAPPRPRSPAHRALRSPGPLSRRTALAAPRKPPAAGPQATGSGSRGGRPRQARARPPSFKDASRRSRWARPPAAGPGAAGARSGPACAVRSGLARPPGGGRCPARCRLRRCRTVHRRAGRSGVPVPPRDRRPARSPRPRERVVPRGGAGRAPGPSTDRASGSRATVPGAVGSEMPPVPERVGDPRGALSG